MEFEISGDKTDAAENLNKLRESVEGIVSDSDIIDNLMLCTGELVSDMRRTSDHIHLRLRDEGKKAELFIRSIGKRWDLPASISEEVKAFLGKEAISYSYVYRMNIVCIILDERGASNAVIH